MTFQARSRWFAPIVFAALLLSACGFHLRGQIDIPTSLQNLTLALDSGSSEFNRDLRIALAKSDINIVEEPPREGLYELKVNPLTTSDTVLARASDNDVTQIERRISSTYFVRDEEGKAIWGPRNISVSIILNNQDAEQSLKSAYNAEQMQRAGSQLANELLYDLSYAPL